MEIAKRFLVRKQMEATGLTKDQIEFADSGVNGLIQYYSREAGVRNLEREIGNVCRKIARQVVNNEGGKEKKPLPKALIDGEKLTDLLGPWRFRDLVVEKKNEIGGAVGLAWTEVGGQLLTVECTLMEGKGKLTITGKLGEVMQESAQAAMSYIRSRAHLFGLPRDFYRNLDMHIHVPEGAIPKDGPSAGITAGCTTICSALTRIPVRGDVAMTGEITLRGRVLADWWIEGKADGGPPPRHSGGDRSEREREGSSRHSGCHQEHHETALCGIDGRSFEDRIGTGVGSAADASWEPSHGVPSGRRNPRALKFRKGREYGLDSIVPPSLPTILIVDFSDPVMLFPQGEAPDFPRQFT